MDAKEEKRSIMLENLAKIKHTILNIDERVKRYAEKLNEIGVLTEKRYDDCLHIGFAVVNGCNMILSWNFSHIVRVKTINGVRYVNSILGYGEIGIYAPSMVIERDDFDG